MNAYATLHLLDDVAARERMRKELLAYFHLDTLAMVKILEKLFKVCLDNAIVVTT